MAQVTTGIRAVLSSAATFQWFQDALGARRIYRRLAAELGLRAGDHLLDIGCGPGAILDELAPEIEYFGFDESEAYVAAGRRRHPGRGTFWTARVENADLSALPRFEGVLAVGVLHHLDDAAADGLFALARRALAPGGRLVTYDPSFVDRQSPIARLLVSRDRGRHVRRPEGYEALARAHFPALRRQILAGHLRVPYTAAVLVCTAPD